MPIFEPPVLAEVPRVSYPISHHDARFWGYFRRGGVGTNVYKLVDGSYTQVQPARPEDVAVWYLGGHIYDVSDAEAAALTAAGYDVSTEGMGRTIGELAGSTVGGLSGTEVGDL